MNWWKVPVKNFELCWKCLYRRKIFLKVAVNIMDLQLTPPPPQDVFLRFTLKCDSTMRIILMLAKKEKFYFFSSQQWGKLYQCWQRKKNQELYQCWLKMISTRIVPVLAGLPLFSAPASDALLLQSCEILKKKSYSVLSLFIQQSPKKDSFSTCIFLKITSSSKNIV